MPGSKQGIRQAVMCQKVSNEPGSKQETRLLGSQQETRLLGVQQGIREPARHQKGSNVSRASNDPGSQQETMQIAK